MHDDGSSKVRTSEPHVSDRRPGVVVGDRSPAYARPRRSDMEEQEEEFPELHPSLSGWKVSQKVPSTITIPALGPDGTQLVFDGEPTLFWLRLVDDWGDEYSFPPELIDRFMRAQDPFVPDSHCVLCASVIHGSCMTIDKQGRRSTICESCAREVHGFIRDVDLDRAEDNHRWEPQFRRWDLSTQRRPELTLRRGIGWSVELSTMRA